VLVEKFGIRGKHIAAKDEHVSDLSVKAAERLVEEHDLDPTTIDAVVYFGSMWRDYACGRRPRGSRTASARRTRSRSSTATSRAAGPMALRPRAQLPDCGRRLGNVLLVGASRESYLLDYANERSRFMFNFGDGAVPSCSSATRARTSARVERDHRRLALSTGEGAVGRQRRHERRLPLPRRRRPRGDEGAPRRGEPAELRPRGRGALERSGATLADVDFPVRAAHEALDARRARHPRWASIPYARSISTTRGT
jgi:3-oxoacyl-[acyl-carrier-protein] synthase-3